MHNIGIFGHNISDLAGDLDGAKKAVCSALDTIKIQYGKSLSINLDGEIGIGHIAGEYAKVIKVKYHMFIPCPVELIGEEWYDEQRASLERQLNTSSATTIIGSRLTKNNFTARDQKVIDSSSFVICFWNGKKQGRTFDMIKYSLLTNKLVLNGLNDLKLVSAVDTKPTKRVR
jgi:uncharacterized phage-like protein YoqJ